MLIDGGEGDGGEEGVHVDLDGGANHGADAHHHGETLQVHVAQVLVLVFNVLQHQPAL